MTKPRDSNGNDFIVASGFLANELFHARYKRLADPKSASDSSVIRAVASDIHAVLMRHWKAWEREV